MKRSIVLGILVAGCGSAKSEPPPTEERCAAAVTHAVTTASWTFEVAPERVQTVMIKHCVADRWPASALKCLDAIAGATSLTTCLEPLPRAKTEPIFTVMFAKADVDDFGQRAVAEARRIAEVALSNDCSAIAAAMNKKPTGPGPTMTAEMARAVQDKYGAELTAITAPAQALIEKCGASPEVNAMMGSYEETWSKQVMDLYQKLKNAAITAKDCTELGDQLPGVWDQLEEIQRHTPVTMDEAAFDAKFGTAIEELLAPLKPLLEKCKDDAGVKAFVADVSDGGAT